MSYKRIETLDDVRRFGLFIEVTCPRCSRRVTLDFGTIIPGNTSLGRLAARMRCVGEVGRDNGCGTRGVTLRVVTQPVDPIPRRRPKIIAEHAPPGIDPEAWGNADDRERKRLIRIARG